jgi:hypothetical protein
MHNKHCHRVTARLQIIIIIISGFGGLEIACWPLVPKFAGPNPAEAVGFLKAKKTLSTPSFGGEVKPSVPFRRFVACKRSLKLRGSRILDEIWRNISRPRRVPPSAARGFSRRWTCRRWERLKAGESNGNLPLRTCPGCSVPEPYRSPDWALVPAKPA